MNSGSKAPKAPDPGYISAAQSGSNQSTALYESMLNMQDQRTPYGSLTWQPAGTWSYVDPSTGKTMDVPKFMASSVLSPAQQQLSNQQEQFDSRYNQMAIDQAGAIKDTLSKPFSYSPGEYEQWAGGLYDKLSKPGIDRSRDEFEQSMANRGLNFGTKAYDQGSQDMTEANQRARDSFMLDSYGTGLNTALTLRNQPLKEGAALMGTGQMTEPSWISGPQSGVANTDIGGIYGTAYNQQLAKQAQSQQQSAGVFGALGQLGGAALGGWMASDKRVKEEIEPAGRDRTSGLPVKEWEYKGSEERHRTPLAQDVEKKYPGAVREIDGVKHVDWAQVPGGGKYQRDMARKPYDAPGDGQLQRSNQLPQGKMLRGHEMNPPDDAYNNINKAAPPRRYRDARAGGLQRLGASRRSA